jgi:hypothetical protein
MNPLSCSSHIYQFQPAYSYPKGIISKALPIPALLSHGYHFQDIPNPSQKQKNSTPEYALCFHYQSSPPSPFPSSSLKTGLTCPFVLIISARCPVLE